VVAEFRTVSSAQDDCQLLNSFIGLLDRHFADKIEAMNIQYF